MKIYGGLFDPDQVKKKIEELEKLTKEPNFWNDRNKSTSIINELNRLKKNLEEVELLCNKITEDIETLQLLKEEEDIDIQN